ncbi:hypothetical protein BT63DRAFT_471766 [Microthyrium microscopicum]|uniref:Uncharacterized protein n=1 Tax=Microthyrium microscopicum TaxID=703497 RepID=A0A6A6UCN3_9PEZI|nr:hypothetical protein BT63DRAFT_471766 [Microthyrium microscopicum]
MSDGSEPRPWRGTLIFPLPLLPLATNNMPQEESPPHEDDVSPSVSTPTPLAQLPDPAAIVAPFKPEQRQYPAPLPDDWTPPIVNGSIEIHRYPEGKTGSQSKTRSQYASLYTHLPETPPSPQDSSGSGYHLDRDAHPQPNTHLPGTPLQTLQEQQACCGACGAAHDKIERLEKQVESLRHSQLLHEGSSGDVWAKFTTKLEEVAALIRDSNRASLAPFQATEQASTVSDTATTSNKDTEDGSDSDLSISSNKDPVQAVMALFEEMMIWKEDLKSKVRL